MTENQHTFDRLRLQNDPRIRIASADHERDNLREAIQHLRRIDKAQHRVLLAMTLLATISLLANFIFVLRQFAD